MHTSNPVHLYDKKFSILKKGIGIDGITYTSVKSLDVKKVWKQVKIKSIETSEGLQNKSMDEAKVGSNIIKND